MILLIQDYEPKCEKRREELAQCLRENEESGLFEEIVRVGGRRWTFAGFFDLAAEKFAGKKCVVANSDISFRHDSCVLLGQLITKNAMIALTRWNEAGTPWMVGYSVDLRWYSGTQDVWGFVGGDFVGVGNIPLGEPGCDCRLNAELIRAGAVVWNPALTIRTIHVHAEPNDTDRPSPPGEYGYVELTTTEALGGVVIKTFPESEVFTYVLQGDE